MTKYTFASRKTAKDLTKIIRHIKNFSVVGICKYSCTANSLATTNSMDSCSQFSSVLKHDSYSNKTTTINIAFQYFLFFGNGRSWTFLARNAARYIISVLTGYPLRIQWKYL